MFARKNTDIMVMNRAEECAGNLGGALKKGIDPESAIGGYGLYVSSEDSGYLERLREEASYDKLWRVATKNAREMHEKGELPQWISDYDAARRALDDERAYRMLKKEGFKPGNIPDDVVIGMLEQRAKREYLSEAKPKSSIREYFSSGMSKIGKLFRLKR